MRKITEQDPCPTVGFPYEAYMQLEIGQIIYAVRYENDHCAYYEYHSEPQRTNLSNEERVSGWLGCSYGTDAEALGEYEVVSIERTRMQCARIDDDA